jgi:hypothetical protein
MLFEAYMLGKNAILNDPTDDEIVLAVVEITKGNWPEGYTVDRYFANLIVEEYDRGYAEIALARDRHITSFRDYRKEVGA